MRKFTRFPAPSVLTENYSGESKPRWQVYGERYALRRQQNGGFEFQWPIISKLPLNQLLLPTLKAQTQEHCSYCDIYPLKKGDDTIDHFCPKSLPEHYHKVCEWENLYIACVSCQKSKASLFSELILRPDEVDYQFNIYFVYDYDTHEIGINERGHDESKAKAIETIKVFDLNHKSHRMARQHAFERYNGSQNPILDDFNYRYIFE